MRTLEIISIVLVCIGTLSLLFLVPDNPILHLDDPSYWGVIGYCTVFFTILFLRISKGISRFQERNLLILFLAGMPVIYVANWIRFDGTSSWIYIELLGLFLYSAFAYLSIRRFVFLLAIGIAGHGIWDLWHINQNLYVPNWYAVACAVVDCAVAFYVYARFIDLPSSVLKYNRHDQ